VSANAPADATSSAHESASAASSRRRPPANVPSQLLEQPIDGRRTIPTTATRRPPPSTGMPCHPSRDACNPTVAFPLRRRRRVRCPWCGQDMKVPAQVRPP